jgi:hypothetical protein
LGRLSCRPRHDCLAAWRVALSDPDGMLASSREGGSGARWRMRATRMCPRVTVLASFVIAARTALRETTRPRLKSPRTDRRRMACDRCQNNNALGCTGYREGGDLDARNHGGCACAGWHPSDSRRDPDRRLPSQTAARVETFMIAVLPQTEQPHRNANAEAAAAQSQRVSGCFIGGTLLVGLGLDL